MTKSDLKLDQKEIADNIILMSLQSDVRKMLLKGMLFVTKSKLDILQQMQLIQKRIVIMLMFLYFLILIICCINYEYKL